MSNEEETALRDAMQDLDNAWRAIQYHFSESGHKSRSRNAIEKAIHEVEQLKAHYELMQEQPR